jgi:tetratricopeptide (TPR) repeat protein
MNDMIHVQGRDLCLPCAEAALANVDPAGIPKGSVRRHRDPTICAQCGADAGNIEFPLIAAMPLCGACGQRLRKPPIPVWLKLSLAAMLFLAAVELARNWRLFQVYFEVPAAMKAFDQGDTRRAHELMAKAASHLPEQPALATQEKFLRGLCLLQDNQAPQAIEMFEQVSGQVSPSEQKTVNTYLLTAKVLDLVDQDRSQDALPLARQLAADNPGGALAQEMLHSIEIGAAFDTKDYDKFLQFAREGYEKNRQSGAACAQLASALACKYAVTGDDKIKQESQAMLDQALKLDKGGDLTEYKDRILHRLNTRQIISKKEYDKRFRQNKKGPG